MNTSLTFLELCCCHSGVVCLTLNLFKEQPANSNICNQLFLWANIKSYQDIERGLEGIYQENSHSKVNNSDKINFGKINKTKLTISSIALVTSLPKETVRRKVNELTKKNILKLSDIKGITVGANYKKIFNDFVPRSTFEIIKLVKNWEKTGILEDLLKFKI